MTMPRGVMRPQPLITVTDVEASSKWYQRVLDCQSAHGGAEYERLVSNGVLILQLHSRDVEHHHRLIGDPDAKAYGNGVLLWFETDDFDSAVAQAAEINAEVLKAPHRNPPSGDGGPNHRECWLRDPDGYTVVLASPDGEAGPFPTVSLPAAGKRLRAPRRRGLADLMGTLGFFLVLISIVVGLVQIFRRVGMLFR